MQLVRPLLDAQPSGPESYRRKLAEDCCPQASRRCAVTGARPGRSGPGTRRRAGGGGEQTIRLIFEPPQRIQRIWLRFVETETERTQEFTLRWRPETDGQAREIVR